MNALSSRLRFTKARSSSFYYSFIFLPREKRRAIKAVYAFARRGDDAVDSGRPWAEATEEMAHCRGDLDACYGERAGGAATVVEEARVEAVGRRVRDRLASGDDVVPEGGDVGGAGEHAAEADDGHRTAVASTVLGGRRRCGAGRGHRTRVSCW